MNSQRAFIRYGHLILIQNSIIPPYLTQGATVALISTARKIDVNDIDIAKNVLELRGYNVHIGKHLLAEYNQFCGTDAQRAEDLQNAINNPTVDAVLCFRGGYGSVRILDLVDFTPLITKPKWIGGYSDVTAIHNVLNGLSVASLHGTMPVNFAKNTTEALNSLFDAMEGNTLSYAFDAHELNSIGSATGKMIGGNLSMLYSLCGTKYDIDTSGCILFIEDLDEYLYHVDRMMQNFKLGGKLNNLKGLIVGGMTDMNDNDTPFGKSCEQIIQEAVSLFDYPVCFGFPAGHINDNRSLKFGVNATLKVEKDQVQFFQ